MRIVAFCCLLSVVVAVNEKQLRLEDIEKENLANERKHLLSRGLKALQPMLQQYITPPQQKSAPQPTLQFGFRPMKNQPQKFTQEPQQYVQPPQQQPQYFAIAPHVPAPPQFYFTIEQPNQQQPQQYFTPERAQQYVETQPHYQQLPNLQYITNNHIDQDQGYQQQYVPQQYILLQPYAEPSTNIQNVVDPKGIQYVAYVPQPEETQSPETYVQFQPQVFAEPQFATQYIQPPQETHVTQPQQAQPQIQYQLVPQVPQFQDVEYVTQQLPKQQYSNVPYRQLSQPKSLLDSYIPSIVQYEYFKQNQARANAIQQQVKPSEVIRGKTETIKNYVPQKPQAVHSSSNYNVQYYRPQPQSSKH